MCSHLRVIGTFWDDNSIKVHIECNQILPKSCPYLFEFLSKKLKKGEVGDERGENMTQISFVILRIA